MGQKRSDFFLCAFKIVVEIIPAFLPLGARDFRHFQTLFKALFHNRLYFFKRGVEHKQIKARAAAHRPEINNLVFDRAVSYHGCEKVLNGMCRGSRKEIARVRFFETKVVSIDIVLLMRKVNPLRVGIVIYKKRFDGFHSF